MIKNRTRRMLDCQINEKIRKAYIESVCGFGTDVNEGNNDVYRVQGPSTQELDRVKEQKRREELSPDARDAEDRERKRLEREDENRRREQYADAHRTYMSAAPEKPQKPEATIGADNSRMEMARAERTNDPATKIGNNVYRGIGYIAPVAAFGRFAKAANAIGNGARQATTGATMASHLFSPTRNLKELGLEAAENYGIDQLTSRFGNGSNANAQSAGYGANVQS